MPSFNQVTLIGNLTRDPELRVTPKGTAICQFGICVNREFKDESGQKREEATFIDCEAWSKGGEIIAKYCTKGRPLFVVGRLKLDQWEDKQSGQKRSKLKVVVENFQLLGGRSDAASAPAEERTETTTSLNGGESSRSAGPAQTPAAYEDVPF